jgi:hypothetical protein
MAVTNRTSLDRLQAVVDDDARRFRAVLDDDDRLCGRLRSARRVRLWIESYAWRVRLRIESYLQWVGNRRAGESQGQYHQGQRGADTRDE